MVMNLTTFNNLYADDKQARAILSQGFTLIKAPAKNAEQISAVKSFLKRTFDIKLGSCFYDDDILMVTFRDSGVEFWISKSEGEFRFAFWEIGYNGNDVLEHYKVLSEIEYAPESELRKGA